jgi:hypothetical protein
MSEITKKVICSNHEPGFSTPAKIPPDHLTKHLVGKNILSQYFYDFSKQTHKVKYSASS